MEKGYLVLSDGSAYQGRIIGDLTAHAGEVVFNTSMTGYQEVLTDPSYYGQIVVMTYPLIGNYGMHPDDNQSSKAHVRGFVVREAHDGHDHWRSVQNLDEFLKEQGVVAIDGIDTRAVTRKIREHGVMGGKIVPCHADIPGVVESLQGFAIKGAVKAVTAHRPYTLEPDVWKGKTVAVLDFGVKQNILDEMLGRGLKLKVWPALTNAATLLADKPDGIFLSNGPGDPEELPEVVETVKHLMGKAPIFGICLGHQLLSLAYGGQTEKLKYGHRGGNHPVKDFVRDRVFITSQNHGYVVVEASLDEADVTITHRNVNDQSIEGLKHNTLPIFSVQYHPEASPGPKDSEYLFDQFLDMMDKQAANVD